MKICAIGLRGIPNVMGGIESHCQQLYPRMVALGADVTVLARSPYIDKKSYEFEGVKIVSVWAVRHKLLETFMHTFLSIIYARFFVKPDIVHLHAVGPALFTPFARLLGMKVVITHHGADYNRQKWSSFAKKVLRLGEMCGIVFANKVMVVGKSLSENLKASFNRYSDKIEFVPNGMLTTFKGRLSSDYLPRDLDIKPTLFILAVGRLVPEKGFHDLVRAYKQSSTKAKLVIVGDVDHQCDYSKGLKKSSSDSIIFAGRRSGDELKALYQHAEVFVLPSYHEGLPIVALEAISAGCDVLLSNIAPNLDIGAPEDCYFEVGSVKGLAAKLDDLKGLKLKLDREEFLSRFDWDVVAQSSLNLIKSVWK